MPALPPQRRFVIKGRLPTAPPTYDQANEQELRRILELTLASPLGDESSLEVPRPGIGPVMEAIDRLHGSGTGVSLFPTGSLRASMTSGIFYTAASGLGHPFAVHGSLRVALRKSSGTDGAQCVVPEWPVYSNWSDLGPVAKNFLTPLKYTHSCVAMRHAATAEIGVRSKPNPLSDGTATPTGYILDDVSGVWTPKRRLTAAGSVETLTALKSFSSTVARRIEFVYEEGDTPRLTILVDNEIVYQTSGVANMPEQPSTASQVYGPSVAGNILTSDNRITVEEI